MSYLSPLCRRRIASDLCFLLNYTGSRNICSEMPASTKIKTKKKIKHSQELDLYLNSNAELKQIKDLLPSKLLLRKQSPPDVMYLVDKIVGTEIVNKIKHQLLDCDKNPIIEVNPGLGILTDQLENSGVTIPEVFESMSQFVSYLKGRNPRFHVTYGDFLSIWKLAYQDRFDNGGRVANLLKNIPQRSWTSDPPLRIIATLPNNNLIKHLIYAIVFQTSITSYGRPEIFAVMPPAMYSHLTAGPETGYMTYRATSVLFQLLFDYRLLHKVPKNAFLPWYLNGNITTNTTKKKKGPPIIFTDSEKMYLVKISAKRELPVIVEHLQPMWYFIRQHMLSRSEKIIPRLERWIPGCGSQILSRELKKESAKKQETIGIFTEIGELEPNQILSLFKQFFNLPEFPECPFMASMETSLLKMESTEDATPTVDIEDTTSSDIDNTNLDNNSNRESVIDQYSYEENMKN